MTAVPEEAVQVQVLPHGRGLALPVYATDAAAGCDVAAAVPADEPIVLAPGQRSLVPTGVCVALPAGHELQVRPRSGLALRYGVTVLNAPGTIDADYRGELQVLLVNHGAKAFTITRGMRVAQLVLAPVSRARWTKSDVLPETERAAGGFGSTGAETPAVRPR